MRRVESVIDTWYDSGAMPFAQFHYPFENEELFEERFPADYICEAQDQTRGWFYTLLAESTLLFERVELPQLRLPRPDPRPRGPEDVEEPRQRRRPLGRARRPRRRRLPLVLPGDPAALGRLPLLGRDGRRVGAPVPAHPLEHLLVLGPLRERRGPRPARFPTGRARARPPTSTAGRSRGCRRRSRRCASGWTTSTAPPPGEAIAEYVEELSNWYVRLSRRRFWDGDRAAFATLRHCLLETAAMLAPFTPFLADEIHLNLAGGDARRSPSGSRTRSTCATSRRPTRRSPTPSWRPAMEAVRLTVELGRAARAQAKAKVRQPLRRAVIVANDAERAAIEARADLVTAELNVKELDFVTDEGELVSYAVEAELPRPSARASARRCRRWRPRWRRSTPPTSPQVLADGGEVGIAIDGDDHTLGRRGPHPRPAAARGLRGRGRGRPRGRPAARARRGAAPRGPRPRDRPRGPERAQSRPASRSPTGSRSASAATRSCSRPPASTRPTWPARCWRPRSPSATATGRR